MQSVEIIDDNGIIHSGSEEEMREAFAAMTDDADYFDTKKAFKEAKKTYATEWSGDLKLVIIMEVAK